MPDERIRAGAQSGEAPASPAEAIRRQGAISRDPSVSRIMERGRPGAQSGAVVASPAQAAKRQGAISRDPSIPGIMERGRPGAQSGAAYDRDWKSSVRSKIWEALEGGTPEHPTFDPTGGNVPSGNVADVFKKVLKGPLTSSGGLSAKTLRNYLKGAKEGREPLQKQLDYWTKPYTVEEIAKKPGINVGRVSKEYVEANKAEVESIVNQIRNRMVNRDVGIARATKRLKPAETGAEPPPAPPTVVQRHEGGPWKANVQKTRERFGYGQGIESLGRGGFRGGWERGTSKTPHNHTVQIIEMTQIGQWVSWLGKPGEASAAYMPTDAGPGGGMGGMAAGAVGGAAGGALPGMVGGESLGQAAAGGAAVGGRGAAAGVGSHQGMRGPYGGPGGGIGGGAEGGGAAPGLARARTPWHSTMRSGTWAGKRFPQAPGRGVTPFHDTHPGFHPGNYPAAGDTQGSDLKRFADAIEKQEGYGKPGAIPTMYHNPGDIMWGPWAKAHGALRKGATQEAVFPDYATGRRAMEEFLPKYHGYSIAQVNKGVSGKFGGYATDPRWGAGVSHFSGIPLHQPLNLRGGVGAGAAGGPTGGVTTLGPGGRLPPNQAAKLGFQPIRSPSGTVQVKSPSGATWNVAPRAAPQFRGFLKDLEATGYRATSSGGWNYRTKRGGSSLSQHAYGTAIDIDAAHNPFRSSQTNLPPQTSALARKWGLSWGKEWSGTKDPMHFEVSKLLAPGQTTGNAGVSGGVVSGGRGGGFGAPRAERGYARGGDVESGGIGVSTGGKGSGVTFTTTKRDPSGAVHGYLDVGGHRYPSVTGGAPGGVNVPHGEYRIGPREIHPKLHGSSYHLTGPQYRGGGGGLFFHRGGMYSSQGCFHVLPSQMSEFERDLSALPSGQRYLHYR